MVMRLPAVQASGSAAVDRQRSGYRLIARKPWQRIWRWLVGRTAEIGRALDSITYASEPDAMQPSFDWFCPGDISGWGIILNNEPCRIRDLERRLVVGRRGTRQSPADRLDIHLFW